MIHKIIRGILLAIIVLGYNQAYAATSFIGKWSDLGDDFGELTIGQNSIIIQGRVRYSTADAVRFGNDQLFKVTGVDHHPDPICGLIGMVGPEAVVTYIVIIQLPYDQIEAVFYTGSKMPNPSTIKNAVGVCNIHAFSPI